MVTLWDEQAKFGFVSVGRGKKGEQGLVGMSRGLQTHVLLAIWPKDKDGAYLPPPQDALCALVQMPTRPTLQAELHQQLNVKPNAYRQRKKRFNPFKNVPKRLARLNWLLDPKAAAAEQEAGAFLLERAKQLATNFFSGCV